jgi:hypothetical protein
MTVADIAPVTRDATSLLGDWRNTNARGGITRIVCSESPNGLAVHCFGADDWGTVDARLYGFTFDSPKVEAFSAVFDLGFAEVRLQVNVKLGVLVVASFNRFNDASGRSNYFDREFFYRVHE